MATSLDFLNKVALVTGASSGLGQATAILLAKRGASVVLCGRDKDRLLSAVGKCVEASGGNTDRFTSVVGDITKPEVRKAMIDKAIETFQQLDILVTNAGVMLNENGIANTTEDIFDETFNTNVKSVFFLIQNALPYLEKAGGNIVSVSSLGSKLALYGRTVYTASKAALDHMTRCLALDLASKGIRVNSVNPSFVPTGICRAFGDDEEAVKQRVTEVQRKNQPLYGECVTAEAIADSVAFLASDAAKFVTGQCHIVDGGRCFLGSIQ